MSQAMLGHCGLEVLSILPQKTAWAKDDEATLSKHQAELLRFQSADPGYVVNRGIGCQYSKNLPLDSAQHICC